MRSPLLVMMAILLLVTSGKALPLEKLKFGTSIKDTPIFYMPVLTAEDKGFWGMAGLQVEWVPFRGGTDQMRAAAAGEVKTGIVATVTMLQAAAAGVANMAVAELVAPPLVSLYVLPDSKINQPEDIKGTKVGIFRFGSLLHYNARVAARALGLEKDVKYVGTGGFPETLAALRARRIEVAAFATGSVFHLTTKGQLKEILRVSDYFPKEWLEDVIFAQRDLVRERPDVVAAGLRASLRAIDFIRKNPPWSIDKMRAVSGYSEETAKRMHDYLSEIFTQEGIINEKALKNVVDLSISYGIIEKGKMPGHTQLFTNEFTRQK